MWLLLYHAAIEPLLNLLEWTGPRCVALCLPLQHALVLYQGPLTNISGRTTISSIVLYVAGWQDGLDLGTDQPTRDDTLW